jgi:hypothetical protein
VWLRVGSVKTVLPHPAHPRVTQTVRRLLNGKQILLIGRCQFDMEPRIETVTPKSLVGKRMKMSLSNNKTGELWRRFIPRRREIQNNLTSEMFSMQVYDQSVRLGNLNQEFEKWAAVEVTDFDTIPDGSEK